MRPCGAYASPREVGGVRGERRAAVAVEAADAASRSRRGGKAGGGEGRAGCDAGPLGFLKVVAGRLRMTPSSLSCPALLAIGHRYWL